MALLQPCVGRGVVRVRCRSVQPLPTPPRAGQPAHRDAKDCQGRALSGDAANRRLDPWEGKSKEEAAPTQQASPNTASGQCCCVPARSSRPQLEPDRAVCTRCKHRYRQTLRSATGAPQRGAPPAAPATTRRPPPRLTLHGMPEQRKSKSCIAKVHALSMQPNCERHRKTRSVS